MQVSRNETLFLSYIFIVVHINVNMSLCVQVKQLRLEREREKTMREQELEMLQREKEAEHFKTWAEQEDNFHLHQAKLRYNTNKLSSDSQELV